jgi:hypothetical protein
MAQTRNSLTGFHKRSLTTAQILCVGILFHFLEINNMFKALLVLATHTTMHNLDELAVSLSHHVLCNKVLSKTRAK